MYLSVESWKVKGMVMGKQCDECDREKQLASHIKGLVSALMKCYPCSGKDTEKEVTGHVLGLFWAAVNLSGTGNQVEVDRS